MIWIWYTIGAYGVVSMANIIDKILVDKYIKDSSIVVLFTGSVALVTGIVIYLLRGLPTIPVTQFVIVTAAGMLLAWYLLPYFKALELEDASTVVPLFQVVPIFSLILSFLFLHEQLRISQYVGFLLILLSGVALSISSSTKPYG